ncbi:Ctr copper transporter, partial [Phascolomyces articulosus]
IGTFHWTTHEANTLWLSGWIPTMEDQYLSVFLGLFLMAILARGLGALNIHLTTSLRTRDYNQLPLSMKHNYAIASNVVNKRNSRANIRAGMPWAPPFVWSTDTLSSILTTLEHFLMFLLTMIVMTGNVQYFVSILLGIFAGEMIFGRLR